AHPPTPYLHSFPTRRSSDLLSTNRKLRESSGSWKFGLRFRQSSSGRVAIRSRVMAPLSSPDAIGEYTITPILCCKAKGRTEVSRSEEHTSELQSLRHLVCRL